MRWTSAEKIWHVGKRRKLPLCFLSHRIANEQRRQSAEHRVSADFRFVLKKVEGKRDRRKANPAGLDGGISCDMCKSLKRGKAVLTKTWCDKVQQLKK